MQLPSFLGGGKKSKGSPRKPASKPKPDTQKSLDSEAPKVKSGLQVLALITSKIDGTSGKRMILAEQTVSLDVDWFYCKAVNKSYFVDSQDIFLFGSKRHIMLYDIAQFEPLAPHDPSVNLAGLEPHWSSRADHILRLGFVRQTVGAGQNVAAASAPWMQWVVPILLGVAIGYFVGQSLPISAFIHSNTLPASTSP
jgi:hypothetical protein